MSVSSLCRTAQSLIGDFVGVSRHADTTSNQWHDRTQFDPFGEVIDTCRGNTIYLYERSERPAEDLFHELGHAVARHFDVVGHRDNGWRGHWDDHGRRLSSAIRFRRHWSRSLVQFAAHNRTFEFNAPSETWAELFMLHHLYPELEEARLVDDEMARLGRNPRFRRLQRALNGLRGYPSPKSAPKSLR